MTCVSSGVFSGIRDGFGVGGGGVGATGMVDEETVGRGSLLVVSSRTMTGSVEDDTSGGSDLRAGESAFMEGFVSRGAIGFGFGFGGATDRFGSRGNASVASGT